MSEIAHLFRATVSRATEIIVLARRLLEATQSSKSGGHGMGYTFGMKTAVSLPDDLFADAERIARRLKKPRSRVYSEAIREYVARHDPDLVAGKLNEVVRTLDGPDDGFVAAAGRQILERTDW
jgi:predicted transcriptional regulator